MEQEPTHLSALPSWIVVCAAADFLAEHDPISLPPLLEKERELGIDVPAG